MIIGYIELHSNIDPEDNEMWNIQKID